MLLKMLMVLSHSSPGRPIRSYIEALTSLWMMMLMLMRMMMMKSMVMTILRMFLFCSPGPVRFTAVFFTLQTPLLSKPFQFVFNLLKIITIILFPSPEKGRGSLVKDVINKTFSSFRGLGGVRVELLQTNFKTFQFSEEVKI